MSQQTTKFIANNAITNAKLAQAPTLTLKGNNTGGTANEADLTVSQVNTMLGDLLIANNLSDVASKSTSFNNISPMTTGGDLIYGGSSGAGTRLANGSNGQVLTSSGSTSAPTWTTPSTVAGSYNVVSKTTTYAISATDNVILCSGSAFTVTLPTAVGATGHIYIIQKTDSSKKWECANSKIVLSVSLLFLH